MEQARSANLSAATAHLACRLDEPGRAEYLPWAARALCNGKTLAFQAKDAGSIPAARSIPSAVILPTRPRWAALLKAFISKVSVWAFRIG